MQQPVDYPVPQHTDAKPEETAPQELTYADLIQRAHNQKPVTNDMIQTACKKIQLAQEDFIES